MASKLGDQAKQGALKIFGDAWSVAREAIEERRQWRQAARERSRVVLSPYTNLRARWRFWAKLITPIALGFFCLFYGFLFALTAPYLLVPMAVPIGILLLMAIWAIPESAHIPTRSLEVCFSAMIIGLVLWPNYLALSLPGLPWITMVRLTGFPMMFLLMVCASASPEFRRRISQSASSIPLLTRFFAAFVVIMFATTALSKHPTESFNKVMIYQLNWTCVFLVSLYVCRVPGRATRYLALLCLLSIPIMWVAVQEALEQKVLWAGHVPSFLRVEDATAQRALVGSVRGATGQYRTKATFSTALGLAEYLSLMTPFFMHGAVTKYNPVIRLVSLALLPIGFWVMRLTDARLGVAGFLISILSYLLFWSLVRWRQRMSDIISSAIVYAYPTFLAAAIGAVMFIHKVHVLVFGSGSNVASDEARANQFRMGIPKIITHPLGHGAAQAGQAMGYGAGDFVAVDSYYLSVALDYGFLGLILFVGMFGMGIGYAVSTMMRSAASKDREAHLLVPLASCLCAFLVVKAVFEQADNHPIVYMVLGMVAALVTRIKAGLPEPVKRKQAIGTVLQTRTAP